MPFFVKLGDKNSKNSKKIQKNSKKFMLPSSPPPDIIVHHISTTSLNAPSASDDLLEYAQSQWQLEYRRNYDLCGFLNKRSKGILTGKLKIFTIFAQLLIIIDGKNGGLSRKATFYSISGDRMMILPLA